MLATSYREIKQQGYEYKGYVAENFVQQELAALGYEPTFSWGMLELRLSLSLPMRLVV